MEGREPIGLSGPPGSFGSIFQRGVNSSQAQPPPRPTAINIAANPNPSNSGHGNPSPVPGSADSSIAATTAGPSHMNFSSTRAEPFKRKRGRPRKYGPDGSMALALAPISSSLSSGAFTPLQKRGRGRPPGSGRRQQLAAFGNILRTSPVCLSPCFPKHSIKHEEHLVSL
eukprot:TRINITY_DN1373_c1_g1_i1.p1 TRINITY_DN1373_c1_g1~~TRINITY_DN1373_c1_g1_i1.p1  ORF type:complete len:170 (-),score=15.58 TRINITY_DN1373_c1_g1_i1:136-645(-)